MVDAQLYIFKSFIYCEPNNKTAFSYSRLTPADSIPDPPIKIGVVIWGSANFWGTFYESKMGMVQTYQKLRALTNSLMNACRNLLAMKWFKLGGGGSQSKFLSELPKSVFCEILSEWIDPVSLTRFDSSFCSKIYRKLILELASFSGFTVDGLNFSEKDEVACF